jgi:hypothetical protein
LIFVGAFAQIGSNVAAVLGNDLFLNGEKSVVAKFTTGVEQSVEKRSNGFD